MKIDQLPEMVWKTPLIFREYKVYLWNRCIQRWNKSTKSGAPWQL